MPTFSIPEDSGAPWVFGLCENARAALPSRVYGPHFQEFSNFKMMPVGFMGLLGDATIQGILEAAVKRRDIL